MIIYCADFETTSLTNLEKDGYVRVWLWSLVSADRIGEQTEYHGSTISEFMDKIVELKCDIVFFHNLRFDGKFIIDYLERNYAQYGENYELLADDMGNWYQIMLYPTPENKKNKIRIWDSLKKFPGQSVNDVASMFKIEGKKEKPYFDLYRPEGYEPTPEEIEYCLQDSRIVAHAISDFYERGYTKMTLASDAFKEVKNILGGFQRFNNIFPPLDDTMYDFIEPSYKGGFVYVNPRYQDKDIGECIVLDINSMYPDKMRNYPLPFGEPILREPKGDEQFIISFEAEFDLKEDHIPTIQIKNMPKYYSPTQYVVSTVEPAILTLTSLDYKLFLEHYDVHYMSEPTYVTFRSKTGLLRDYVDKYMQQKEEASDKGDRATKFEAKRFLNTPYGKMGTKKKRVNRIPDGFDSTGTLKFYSELSEAKPVYMPYATFTTAWARYNIIHDAQKCFDRFIYADTDSLHLIGSEPPEGLNIHPTHLGAWKLEGHFAHGKYLRPKTYIHADENYNVVEVKCAGMPDNVKTNVTWDSFKIGAQFDTGKLSQVTVPGGCVLKEVPFTIKENVLRMW